MNKEKTLGIKTLLFYIFQKTIFSIFILLLALNLPNLVQFLISHSSLAIDPTFYDTINRVGNILVAVLFLLFLFIIVVGIMMSLVKYFSTTYTFDEYSFKMRQGLIAKNEISIPYKQIQDVNLNQSIFFRIIGLSSLVVLSAAGGVEEGSAEGETNTIFKVMDSEIAESLRTELLKRSSAPQEVIEVKRA